MRKQLLSDFSSQLSGGVSEKFCELLSQVPSLDKEPLTLGQFLHLVTLSLQLRFVQHESAKGNGGNVKTSESRNAKMPSNLSEG